MRYEPSALDFCAGVAYFLGTRLFDCLVRIFLLCAVLTEEGAPPWFPPSLNEVNSYSCWLSLTFKSLYSLSNYFTKSDSSFTSAFEAEFYWTICWGASSYATTLGCCWILFWPIKPIKDSSGYSCSPASSSRIIGCCYSRYYYFEERDLIGELPTGPPFELKSPWLIFGPAPPKAPVVEGCAVLLAVSLYY